MKYLTNTLYAIVGALLVAMTFSMLSSTLGTDHLDVIGQPVESEYFFRNRQSQDRDDGVIRVTITKIMCAEKTPGITTLGLFIDYENHGKKQMEHGAPNYHVVDDEGRHYQCEPGPDAEADVGLRAMAGGKGSARFMVKIPTEIAAGRLRWGFVTLLDQDLLQFPILIKDVGEVSQGQSWSSPDLTGG